MINVVAKGRCPSRLGLATLLEALEIQPATSATCRAMLEDGQILAISPGGVREALFSDKNYQLIWKERKGFARVAIDARAVSAIDNDATENDLSSD